MSGTIVLMSGEEVCVHVKCIFVVATKGGKLIIMPT